MTLRDRLRILLFFTPWVSAPLALLGILLGILYPLMQWTWVGWVIYGVTISAAAAFALRLRARYRMSILDSSPLGILTWLQRR
jgi:hypothetical protein